MPIGGAHAKRDCVHAGRLRAVQVGHARRGPALEAAGLDVEVVDLRERPCYARAFGVDVVPTVIAHDGMGHRIRCRGVPCEDAIRAMCADTYE